MNCKKSIDLLILAAMMLACNRPQSETVVLASDSGLVQMGRFLVYNNEKFSGDVIERFVSGQDKSVQHFENGLLEGKSKSWFPSGATETERNYHNGEKEGLHRGWWPNGNLRFEYEFSKGLYNGTFKEWYEKGMPLNLFTYKNGEEVSAVGWRENGKTYINFIVREGRKYGLTNARLCYSLKDEVGVYKTVKQ